MFGSAIIFAAVCATAQEPVYTSSDYQCKIFSRYLKDSGLINLKRNGQSLISRNGIFASIKGPDGKNTGIIEKANPEYEWKDNVLSQEKLLIPRNAKDGNAEPYAKVSRKISFSPDKIEVEITVKNLKDLTLAQSWHGYAETIFVVTGSVIGMRLDGIKADGQKISTVIPRKYDKKKWGFNKYVKALTLTDSEKFAMTATASPNCSLRFNNYGGKNCELSVRPSLKQTELNQKAGQETKFGYTIKFGKAE